MNRSDSLTEWQRRVALDFARACSLEPVTPIRATGQHRVAENDEPEPIDRGPLTVPSELTEADWIAADLAEDANKAARRNAISDAAAMDLERAVQARSEWRMA